MRAGLLLLIIIASADMTETIYAVNNMTVPRWDPHGQTLLYLFFVFFVIAILQDIKEKKKKKG